MLLPEIKEREHRFRLALRIGLPIFALVIALTSHTLITTYQSLQASFYIESTLLLLFSVYFIFYLLYNGFNVKIRDEVSGAFTREYLYKYLEKEIRENKDYSLMLISVDNLHDINQVYGIKNGDKTLRNVVEWIVERLRGENIDNVPIGQLKGGDFLVGLKGKKETHSTMLELICLKTSEFKVDDIEVKISAAITDTDHSRELNFMVENLFESQSRRKNSTYKEEEIDPNELESLIIQAIRERSLSVISQSVFDGEERIFNECFVRLTILDGQYVYPKKYLKVLNKLRLTPDFDLMVVEDILLRCEKLKDEAFAVNISPTSLRNDKFLSSIKAIFKDNENMGKRIIFLLSEQEYYSYVDRYKSIINSLRRLGVMIAIDRVGSLHSSFLYLRELDVDMIRIDSYYSDEAKMRENRSIIDGFNLIAHEKGIKTWIKNLEDKRSVDLAKEMKIDYVQGKYLADLEKDYTN